ncbi:AMP-binding protein [Thermaurantiacus sp.]
MTAREPARLDQLLGQADPAAPALLFRQGAITHGELQSLVDRVAAGLAAQIAPGDRVAVFLPKLPEAVVALFAISRAGGVAVPVNPLLKGPQVAHILADAEARLLLTHAPRAALLAAPPCPVLTLEDDWPGLAAAAAALPDPPGGDCLAMLFYTSGSTGRPKGVMVTHRNLLVGAASVASYLGTAAQDRVLAVLPFSFDFGFSQLTTAFHAGAAVILLDYLTPRDVVAAAVRHGATQLAAVPPLWMQLAELDWPKTRLSTLSASGGRMPEPTVRALRRRFPDARLHLMYGLTEAFRSTTLPPELVDTHPWSIGRAIPGAEVLVVRPDGSLTKDGEPGELVHCGPLVTKGYWRDCERTAQRFRPAPPASHFGGTAVWSGDTVVREADGLLRFIGRKDETIKTMGMRVSPTEIEEVAIASGAVSAAVALGVPDPAAGMRIRLVAVLAAGLSEADARARLATQFRREAPSHFMPSDICFLASLPLSPNGKIDRVRLRQDYGG